MIEEVLGFKRTPALTFLLIGLVLFHIYDNAYVPFFAALIFVFFIFLARDFCFYG